MRFVLSLAEMPYSVAMRLRNRRFDLRRAKAHRVGVPVICIGNLTMGGTGKTPMVQFVAEWFLERDVRVAIVSRGYRAAAGEQNDEAKELSEKLPSVPHIQNADRVAAATLAIEEFNAQLVLLDDGFQHRRLKRDLDVVLVDALEPFGFDHVFPRGMLREPLDGLQRAHLVVLTRADFVSAERRDEIRQQVLAYAPHVGWIEVAHTPVALRGRGTTEDALAQLQGKRVLAFCGLGNPSGFRNTLEACGTRIAGFREFPDHHDYSQADVEGLRDWIQKANPEMVICTHKDLVKVDLDQLSGVPLRALLVELRVLVGEGVLHESLSRVLESTSESASS